MYKTFIVCVCIIIVNIHLILDSDEYDTNQYGDVQQDYLKHQRSLGITYRNTNTDEKTTL